MASEARAEFDPKEIARAAFPTAFRGYDQDAVRRYLSRLASAIGRAQQLGLLDSVETEHDGLHSRETELELEASELRARIDELEDLLRSQPGLDAVHAPLVDRDLDEAELIELLGQETARILEQARSAGADIVHRAEAEAAAIKEQADLDARAAIEQADSILAAGRIEAEETRGAAAAEAKRSQARIKAETKRSRELAKSQAEEIMTEASAKVEDDLAAARSRANQIVSDSEQLREDVVGDLVRRRRIYQEQLDRMATARDRLAQALAMARSELETVSADIERPMVPAVDFDLDDDIVLSEEQAEADANDVAALIAQFPLANTSSEPLDYSGTHPTEDRVERAFSDEVVVLDDDDADTVLVDESDFVNDVDLSDPDDGGTGGEGGDDGLKVEYLALGNGAGPAGHGPTGSGDGSLTFGSGPDTLTLGSFDAAPVALQHSSSNGLSNGSSPSVLDASNAEVGVRANEMTLDEYDLPMAPVMGGGPGAMHRAATRGDLPRTSPYGGTLPAAFEGRDLALTRATPGFRRRLKRAVNDDQSHVLDRLRAGRGELSADELPTIDEQMAGYVGALEPALADVVKAGGELLGSTAVPRDAVENLCLQLGKHIVECLRRPTIEAIETTTDTDREAILDPVRATYRDFRNSVLPDLIEDALHEAFALGLFNAIDQDERVLWLTDPRLDPDPICEENSAAPPLLRGTLFPSGHVRPLSMPGCRCLAIPIG